MDQLWLLVVDHIWPVFSGLVVAWTIYYFIRAGGTSKAQDSNLEGSAVEVYVGERDADGKKHGRGKLTYPNRSSYEGQFVNDKPWGRGEARSKGGDIYKGEWLDGKRHNKGELHYSDGSCFVGTFRMGKKHGRGVLTLANLDSVEGVYEEGVMVEAIIRSRDHIYEGEVRNFKPHGRGRMIFIVSAQSEVEGKDLDGREGGGRSSSIANTPLTMKFSETLESIVHDNGTHGDTYYGTWSDGLMDGHGIYHFCENDAYYEGEFHKNLLHGRGRLSVIHSRDDIPEDAVDDKERRISTFEGIFEHGVPAAFGIYRSWLGSEYEGELKLLHMEDDGSFSPSKNRAAASRETDTVGKRSRLNSLAESAKKLFMGTAQDYSDDEDDDEEGSEGELGSPMPSVNGMSPRENEYTPRPTREQRFVEGARSRERGDSVTLWEDPLAFMHAHGKGTFIYPNKDKFTGQLEGNLKHGHGKMVYANGSVYEGHFESDLFHGKGTYTQVMKDQGTKTYTGYFQCGERSGVGKLVFPSGACYEGQWSHDCMWGTGKYEFSNGDVYTGSFIDGKRNDVGRVHFANGSTFQGHWKDDRRVKGEFVYKNGNIYVGSFNDKVMEGIGRFEWADGSTYEGGWLDNKAHGIGRFTKPGKSGYVYEGNWKANKKHTEKDTGELARVIYANGDEYIGSFVNGRMTGPGKKTFASGAEDQVGDFLDGTYQGPSGTNAADL